MRQLVAVMVFLAAFGVVVAGGLEEGDKEMSFRLSYADTDFGTAEGFDLGSVEETDIALTYGWLVSGGHEFGGVLGYFSQDIEGGDALMDTSDDALRFGVFYNYNFSTSGDVNPYIGASVSILEGDLGDVYDMQYGAEIGIKFYPFEHGGFSIGLGYNEFSADADGLPDADSLSLGAGILIKY